MSFVGNTLEIDPTAVMVTNRRLIRQAIRPSRGRILDRNGEVLARTVTGKNGNAFREYPLGPASLPLLGVAHPVYGLKGLERHLSSHLEGKVEEDS
jgi:peptidoglycan glycosyltransferase